MVSEITRLWTILIPETVYWTHG